MNGLPLFFSLLIPALVLPRPTTGTTTEYAGLSKVLLISEGLINGSAPRGDVGLDSLRDLGVRTILCVDASPPDAAGASARGMRYVHLPIGYDGVTRLQALRLMRIATDLEKPLYIHCYHGQHRSPTAAAVIAVGLGWLTGDQALQRLVTAGTSPSYDGLYSAVANMEPAHQEELSAVDATFPQRAEVSDFLANMSRIGQQWDQLKLIREAGWRTPERHPDLIPDREARLLSDYLSGVSQSSGTTNRPAPFGRMLWESRRTVRRLAAVLGHGDEHDRERIFQQVHKTCVACHERFRN